MTKAQTKSGTANSKGGKKSQGSGNATNSKNNQKNNANAAVVQPPTTDPAAAAAAAAAQKSVAEQFLTPEQRRLASLMNDKIDVTDIEKKVNKIIELTGASKDKAIVALHDCANELDKAIDMILEGDIVDDNEWKSQQRKKKPKVTGSSVSNKENSSELASGRHINGDSRRNKRDSTQRGERGNNRGKSDNNNNVRRFANKDNVTSSVSNTFAAASNSNEESEAFLRTDDDNDWGEPVVASVPDFTSNTTNAESNDDFVEPKPRSSNSFQSKPGSRFNNNSNNDRQTSRNSYAGKASGASQGNGNRSNYGRTYQNKNYKEESNTFSSTTDSWNPDSGNKISTWGESTTNDAISEDDWNSAPVETKVFTSSRTVDAVNDQPRKPSMAEIVSGIRPKPTVAAIVKGVASSDATRPVSSTTTQNQQPEVKKSEFASIISGSVASNPAVIQNQSSETPETSDKPVSVAETKNSSLTEQSNKIDLTALLGSSSNQSKPLTSQPSVPVSHPQQQPLSAKIGQSALGSTILPSSATPSSHQTNSAGAALLQQLTQQQQQQQETAPSGYRSMHYSKQATESIKNLVGIPNTESVNQASQFTSNGSSLLDQQQQSHHHRAAGSVSARPSTTRISSRRTKIPESAVEMPHTDHISQLNVQFGALEFGTESHLSESNASNTSANNPSINATSSTPFNELQPPKPPTQSKLPTNQSANPSAQVNSAAMAQASLNQMLNQVQSESAYNKPTPSQELSQMASQLVGSQQLADSVLERNKPNPPPGSSGPSSHHHYSSKPSGLYNQQGPGGDSAANQMYNKYGSDSNTGHYGSSYGQSHSNYGYSNNQQQSSGYGVNSASGNVGGNSYGNSYGTASISSGNNSSNGNHQKLNLKDLENSAASNALSSQQLGLVSSSTSTTNVLKNTLTATGKTGSLAPNVAPNVNPLLGTPQYLISQPGLSAFYPIYDMPMAGREHNFAPYAPQPGGPSSASEPKYGNRNDPSDSNTGVQSNQAPVTQPAGPLFGQFPPHYGFFYTGVNMMPQSLYQATPPFLQVQPPNPAAAAASAGPNAHNQGPAGGAAGFNKPQSQPGYGSHSAFSNYGLSQMQTHGGQDYVSKSYGGNNNSSVSNDSQQVSQSGNASGPGGSSKQNVSSNNDLSNANNMYAKSHAQLTKNYEKPSFQTQTPPPFNMANAQVNANALGSYPNQYMPMLQPGTAPSMLHHSLQSDGSGAGNQRSMNSQKNSSSNKYYNWN